MRVSLRACWAALVITAVAAPARAWWIKDCRTGPTFVGQTARVADINPGPADAASILLGSAHQNGFMGVYRGKLYFQANDGQSGAELWRVDGGVASQVADLVPGAEGSAPHAFLESQGRLYFAATTPATGEELWSYDGTSITLAAEIATGTAGGEIAGLTEFKGAFYFTRYVNAADDRVWQFSGGTVKPAAVINASGAVDGDPAVKSPFVVFGDRLFYVVNTPGPELWAYDGSTTQKIKELAPGHVAWVSGHHLGVYQNALYFAVMADFMPSPPYYQDELWRYAATGRPTKVATLPYVALASWPPGDFEVYDGALYLGGPGFYRFDGAFTQLLAPDPSWLNASHWGKTTYFAQAEQLFFAGGTGIGDAEPFLHDGASARRLENIMPDTAVPFAGSNPTYALEAADGLYFYAADATHGRELWRVTGTVTGRLLECDIVLAPIWEDERLWVIDEPEVLVATWLLLPGAEPRLVAREVVKVERGKQFRVRALRLDTRRQPLPEAYGLVTMVFDRARQTSLEQGLDIVGDAPPPLAAALSRAAAGVLAKGSMKNVVAEPVASF